MNRNIAENLLYNSPQVAYAQDLTGCFTYANKAMQRFCGFANEDQIIGLSYYDIRCEAQKLAHEFERQEQKTRQLGRSTQWIGIANYAHQPGIVLLGTKSLIFDEANKVIGTFDQFLDVTYNPLINLAPILDQQEYAISRQAAQVTLAVGSFDSPTELTKKESSVLFYFIRGMSANGIAQRFNLSKRTIEGHIDNIKDKLHCINKTDLIEKAITQGFLNILPVSLLQNSSN